MENEFDKHFIVIISFVVLCLLSEKFGKVIKALTFPNPRTIVVSNWLRASDISDVYLILMSTVYSYTANNYTFGWRKISCSLLNIRSETVRK